jgi:c(7)-type cytochrome triheme protein
VKAILCFVLALPLTAQDSAFPHRPHLAMGLDCQTCHPAAPASEDATDNLLPDGQVCGACHNGQTAPEIDVSALAQRQAPERSYRFDHSFHLGLGDVAPLIAGAIDTGNYFGKPGEARRFLEGGNACSACHRGLQESLAVDSARNMPMMGDCIVCHTRIDNPFTCKECHRANVDLMPEDHTREFIDLHSTGKIALDKLSCLPCHGRNFACMGCH